MKLFTIRYIYDNEDRVEYYNARSEEEAIKLFWLHLVARVDGKPLRRINRRKEYRISGITGNDYDDIFSRVINADTVDYSGYANNAIANTTDYYSCYANNANAYNAYVNTTNAYTYWAVNTINIGSN